MSLIRLGKQIRRFKQNSLSKLLTLILFLLFKSIPAQAQHDIHLVFDLDWTIINPTTEEMAKAIPQNTFRLGADLYRFSDATFEVLLELHKIPHVRISYFSGGNDERNLAVVDKLYQHIHELHGTTEYRAFKVLSFHHLTQVSDDMKLRFPQRYKKDLARYFDSNWAVLIDDIRGFVPTELSKNEVWLGSTYNDRPVYELAALESVKDAAYSAPNKSEWQRDRDKLISVKNLLLRAISENRKSKATFVESLSQFCRMLF